MAAEMFRRCCSRVEFGGFWDPVSVASAGLLPGGFPSPPEVVRVLGELGIDASAHRSTQLTAELVEASDMIVGMARRHVREVVLLERDAWPRAFTLKELVRRGDEVGPRETGESVRDWLARMHDGRDRAGLVGNSVHDDVADPLGGPLDAYRASAREIAALVGAVAGLLGAPREIRSLLG